MLCTTRGSQMGSGSCVFGFPWLPLSPPSQDCFIAERTTLELQSLCFAEFVWESKVESLRCEPFGFGPIQRLQVALGRHSLDVVHPVMFKHHLEESPSHMGSVLKGHLDVRLELQSEGASVLAGFQQGMRK